MKWTFWIYSKEEKQKKQSESEVKSLDRNGHLILLCTVEVVGLSAFYIDGSSICSAP